MTSIVRIATTHRNLTAGWERFFATCASKPKRGGLARPGGRTAILPQCSRDASRTPADPCRSVATKVPMSVDAKTVRHIAKLARIAVSDAEVEALAPELNNILGWIEQLQEVDVAGRRADDRGDPQPAAPARRRGHRGRHSRRGARQRAGCRARLLRRAQGDRMTGASPISAFAAIRDGVRRGRLFRARGGRGLYRRGRGRAAAQRLHRRDARPCARRRRCRRQGARRRATLKPLSGVPLGIKDLFCTEGVADHRRQPHPRRLQAASTN